MLPSWFAEYSLDLDVVALVVCFALIGYGLIVTATGRFGTVLTDARRTRLPTAIASAISLGAGVLLAVIAAATVDTHARLVESAIASFLIAIGVLGAAGYLIPTIWTNKFWGLPPPESITARHVQALGRVQVFLWLGFEAALVGGIGGLIPKLIYVGNASLRAALVAADVLLIAVGAVFVVQAWRLFRSVRAQAKALDERG